MAHPRSPSGPVACLLVLAAVILPAPAPGAEFLRGDSTADGFLDIADPVRTLQHLYAGRLIACADAADANDSGAIELADGVFALTILYLGGAAPPPPFPDCGIDPTADLLRCNGFDPCLASASTLVGPEGGSLLIEGDTGERITLDVDAGAFEFATEVRGSVGAKPAPLHETPPAEPLPRVGLSFDARAVNSAAAGGSLRLVLPGSFAGASGAATIDDVTVVVEASGRRYFYTFPLEASVGDGIDGGAPGKVAVIPTSIFRRAREWSLVGRELGDPADAVVIEEVVDGAPGERTVSLRRGLERLAGSLEFADGGRRATIQALIRNQLTSFEIDLNPVDLHLEIVVGLANSLYESAATALATQIGDGRLYRISSPDLTLEDVEESPAQPGVATEHAPIVLVHGWELLDPFVSMFEFSSTELDLRPFVTPSSAAAFADLLRDHWKPLLDHLNRPDARGIYLYAHNPLRDLEENAATFAARLEETFTWSSRVDPLTIVGHSSGGLLAAVAAELAFGVDAPRPAALRLVSLGAPFRGTPLANGSFQFHWLGGELEPVFAAAEPLWRELDVERRRLFPIELLGSLTAAATFFRTAAAGARDLDLDALRHAVRGDGFTPSTIPVASELEADEPNWPFRVLGRLLASFVDGLGRRPYAHSDGVVPLASALGRDGDPSVYWFFPDGEPPRPGEIVRSGSTHTGVRTDTALFERLGLGVGRRTSTIGLDTVHVPPGSFLMGSPESETGRFPDEVEHRVYLGRGYFIGVHEVTQAQYEAVIGENPSFFQSAGDSPRRPVERVSWEDAVEFCCRLTLLERREGTIRANERYRLPTEAEWEQACRAGTSTSFSFGNAATCDLDEVCVPCAAVATELWWCGTSGGMTHPVGETEPNAWGLHDVHGNVSEWCHDTYGPYAADEVMDPQGNGAGELRVLRGGSWFESRLTACRSAFRSKTIATQSGTNFGFRVVLATEEGEAIRECE